ncbi:uncharacterized protein N7525_002777 [Penicillium rubens]|jgi:hypothetical protein|uniref:uncharacterized protein n=1 Tax=Penicillium rubens TaxID=1108849 RepID=UPI002A5AF7E8|nr:uncharacterized protein N7525_002777 [Penicillium rubens]KAJ5837589.1 hypothetical protein N7525_002777 [Penicillium rubens]
MFAVNWVGRIALCRRGRIRLNSDRLRRRDVAAIEKAKQCVGLESPFCGFSEPLLFFKPTS